MIAALVVRVFAARNAAHIAHWRTKSYAQHVALSDFYDSAIDSIDSIVEAYQGCFKIISVGDIPKQPETKDIVDHFEDDLLFISENREKITAGIPALDNLLQNLEHVYMRTIYKLKNLG